MATLSAMDTPEFKMFPMSVTESLSEAMPVEASSFTDVVVEELDCTSCARSINVCASVRAM